LPSPHVSVALPCALSWPQQAFFNEALRRNSVVPVSATSSVWLSSLPSLTASLKARTAVSAASPHSFRRCYGPEFVAKAVQKWIGAVGAKSAYIMPGSPWENSFIESFNARLRDELPDSEIFYSLAEAKIIIESWRRHYNTVRPHGSLGHKPPAPEVFVPALAARAAPPPGPATPTALALRPTLNQV